LLDLKGHGLWIGGTLEYLLRGVPFDVVKAMGRWCPAWFRNHAWTWLPGIPLKDKVW
jgi:hypothetical protein